MPEKLKDILSHLSPDIDQETLLRYLEGKLAASEQHEVEKHLLHDDFESDALEGLQALKESGQLNATLEQLQRDLKKKTQKKKALRNKLRLKEQPLLWIAVFIVLLLAVISYFIIHRLHNS